MTLRKFLIGTAFALLITPSWGSALVDFDLETEIQAIEGTGAKDSTRRYINIEVKKGRESLIAAVHHTGFDTLATKSFHERNFFVIDRDLPNTLDDFLETGHIFNKSTPKEFPETSFWVVYKVEGAFNEKDDAFVQEEDGTLFTVGNDEEGTLISVNELPPVTTGLYFALKYREIPKEEEDLAIPTETIEKALGALHNIVTREDDPDADTLSEFKKLVEELPGE